MSLIRSLSATSAFVLASSCVAAAEPMGRYITASGNLEVEVAACGAALCGTVTRVIANRSMTQPGVDMQAADARSALGLRILSDFVPDGDAKPPSEWRGRIFNRENGKTYDCLMSVDAAGNLALRAYVGLPIFGSTLVWQRQVPAQATQDAQPPASAEAGR